LEEQGSVTGTTWLAMLAMLAAFVWFCVWAKRYHSRPQKFYYVQFDGEEVVDVDRCNRFVRKVGSVRWLTYEGYRIVDSAQDRLDEISTMVESSLGDAYRSGSVKRLKLEGFW
jgi:hypothetical protein